MPPKRKNKAAKAASILPPKKPPHTASEGPGTSRPGQVRRNSLGGRTSHLPPFSMTTRRGAKTASAASSANSGSRRSSLDDVAQLQDAPSDSEDEGPAKDSGSPMSNGSSNNKAFMNDSITVATTAPTRTAGKKRRASDSTQSSNTLKTRPSNGLTRNQSDLSEQQPRRKKRKTAAGTPAESADQPPELTDASTAPNSPEQLPDVDGNQSLQNVLPTNGDAPAKTGRRLPGRRRQPHPDINIETDLRRQLKLKMDYRSLAKVQKSILEELSKRTLSNLQKDQNFHTQCPEYRPLMAQLDERRNGRVNQIHAVRTYRMEQSERVRIAEEHIQKEQYINRFHDLQDDFLLQCYFRMKQIEREMKGEDADATDDEDNILPPTYTDEAHHDVEDRIGSKYASRSRAYVEADRELEDDARRRRFALAREAFVAKDEDADDSIEEASGGFARFAGPDRDQAIAHHNLMSMVDAAVELERTPTPMPQERTEVAPVQVIPNAHAVDLMMLAELSTQQTHDDANRDMSYADEQPQLDDQFDEPEPPRAATPPVTHELTRQMSPLEAPLPMPQYSQAAHSSPIKASPASVQPSLQKSHSESNGLPIVSRDALPARVSTHRIMDILNNDQDVPMFRSRESQAPQTTQQEPSTPTMRASAVSQHNTPSHDTAPNLDAAVDNDQPVDQALMDALGGRPSEPPSPHANHQPRSWQSAAPAREPEEAPRRKDPLQKIRELLDRKAREHGREPPDRSQYRASGPSFLPRVSSMQAAQDRQEVAGYDPTRPSAGLYSTSSSAAPLYPTSARRESQDHGPPRWDQDRRMSGSQAPQQPSQSPYSNPPQPHQSEHNHTSSASSAHQSPYTLPPGSLPLPPKPPGPPPSVNFRFAHYDPAPPRSSYPPTSPSYPPSSHAPPLGPPSSQYPHYQPPYQGGYVPPPGSFQAPPPPPPHLAPYQPPKIQQYGGQTILPASMAPPPSFAPHMAYHGQQAPSLPPPPQSAYSTPQGPPPQQQQYEPQRGQETRPSERPEPQPRPRRQYRSWHAPGTQFRTYQGPKGPRKET
ncbi:hypothetical protein HBI39_037980 [Parastagonospora nodorum]|nr:hypothetical protein HBI39_037980 [Parastagonospora nodorum]